MKFQNILSLISISSLALAVPIAEESKESVDFCKVTEHTGKSVKEEDINVGSIGDIGYEIWYQGGENSATFYEDGSFTCSFKKSKDYLCRSGLSFDSTQTHEEIGHLYADFKLVKKDTEDVDYSYVGIYGWSREPLVEYYVVDNWLSQYRPGDWVGEKKHGDFIIDGAEYTVYENTRYNAPSIDGETTFTQFFSVRKEARDCGTIDITAHFKKWEELGMKLGKLHEAKVLGEAGSIHEGTSGTADFPYAKVYIKKDETETTEPINDDVDTEVDVEPTEDVDADVDSEVDAEPTEDIDADVDSEVDAEPTEDIDADVDADVDSEVEADAEAEAESTKDEESTNTKRKCIVRKHKN